MKDSKIQWTHATFNPHWGCSKVSAGCKNCYAETFAKRTGHSVWGEGGARRTFGDKHWAEPLKWNAEAAAAGERRRVFCASMADVFEDHPVAQGSRDRLWPLIASTPWLDWLLLTKRPENVGGFAPWGRHWPANVWLGTTTENQEEADRRIPILLSVPARVRFISAEPLLGPIDLTHIPLPPERYARGELRHPHINALVIDDEDSFYNDHPRVDWVIVGGESGAGARPFALTWARQIIGHCQAYDVACFVKQMGAVLVADEPQPTGEFRTHKGKRQFESTATRFLLKSRKGDDMAEWPADLRVRQWPELQEGAR